MLVLWWHLCENGLQAVIEQGGLQPGGLNFDAKVRRESTDLEDLFIAHIGAMDAFARGLRNAVRLVEEGPLPGMVKVRPPGMWSSHYLSNGRTGSKNYVSQKDVSIAH